MAVVFYVYQQVTGFEPMSRLPQEIISTANLPVVAPAERTPSKHAAQCCFGVGPPSAKTNIWAMSRVCCGSIIRGDRVLV